MKASDRRFESSVFAAILGLCCLVAGPTGVSAQEEAAQPEDPWAPFRLLVGSWEGAIDGRLGSGTGVREYELILDGNFLLSRHASVRLPQEKSPGGDHHRELSIFSFDQEREQVVLRSFMVEGFVNEYACEVEGLRFVCATENVESGSGWRARVTIEIHDPYSFDETFELASPGQELAVYFTNTWTRSPALE